MTAPANDPAIDIDALLLEFRIMLRNIDSEQVNSYGHKEKKFFPKKNSPPLDGCGKSDETKWTQNVVAGASGWRGG